ncbi:MAG: adenosylcobinamide-GDP ribazoletransferase [Eubacteriales bacterium]|nr:adenosylcobinamide-GDP ribazoletransferase [Eubacteriales bacterium]
MNMLCGIVIAFSMYSRIPMPKIEWTKERMRYMLCFFPLVGTVIGAIMLFWMKFGKYIAGNGSLFTAILILIPIIITGGIHMDGFLDTSDALSSYKPTEEKLAILKDSHAGAFAVLMCGCYFVLDFGTFSEVDMQMMKVLAIGYVLSRALSGFSIVTFKKAKNTGLAAAFSDMAQQRIVGTVMIGYIFICAAAMLIADAAMGAVCLIAAILVFLFYRMVSYKKFGGTTGDLAGFFLQICELSMAVVLVMAQNIAKVL